MNANEAIPFMRQALAEAEKARWMTYPNPMVGAVLVRDGSVVAKGFHHGAGEPHAEIMCLDDARKNGINPADCTLCVTLEPCRHFGKTPPCTEAIIRAGIRSVVIGHADPTKDAGGGRRVLEEAGISVTGPVLQNECHDLLADFLLWKTCRRPFVFLKMASTLDGRIATRTGQSQWISSPDSRKEVQKLRKGVALKGGGVLIGGNTFRSDNPKLTVREEASRQPLALVLTSHLPSLEDSFYLLDNRPQETIFLTTQEIAATRQIDQLEKRGVRILPVPQAKEGSIDCTGMLEMLFTELSTPYILCEGGGKLALSLLEEGLVDEFHLHLAPLFLADNEALPLFTGRAPETLAEGIGLRILDTRLCGPDVHLRMRKAL